MLRARRAALTGVCVCVLVTSLAVFVGSAFAAPRTERVSVGSSGEQLSLNSYSPSISADGRLVAVVCSYDNPDRYYPFYGWIYARDRLAGTTELVTVSSAGEPRRGAWPKLSADGRFVAFTSGDSDLVPADTNQQTDIFVRDRLLRTTELVSISTGGEQANDQCSGPAISADGRFVAFVSAASNLVPGDTNGLGDIFVRDRLLGTTERVDVSSSGEEAEQGHSWGVVISDDGRFVVFNSNARNLVPVDANGTDMDVFLRDRVLGTTELVDIGWKGEQANWDSCCPAVNADGRFVSFSSVATNLAPGDGGGVWADVFVRDRLAGTIERINVSNAGGLANDYTWYSSINGDGRFVAFSSYASNLVPGDTNGGRTPTNLWGSDIFVRDRLWSTTERVSVSSSGEQGNGESEIPSISADGRFVAFASNASNLVPGDTNERWDVFVYDRGEQCCATRFADVPFGHWAPRYIESVARAGITLGCGDGSTFCPSQSVTRAQMALFLARAIGGLDTYTPAPCGQERFGDVPCDYLTPGASPSEAYKAIEYIADAAGNPINRAISFGCADGSNYCPERTVTRGQMALFLARAIGGLDSYAAAPCGRERFRDVPCSDPRYWPARPTEAYRAIEYIADATNNAVHRAISRGCGDGTRYCPGDPSTRAEMAAFLARAFLGMD